MGHWSSFEHFTTPQVIRFNHYEILEAPVAKSVTKAELVANIASEAGLKKVQAEKALSAMTGAIQAALVGGRKVVLVGFGTFSVAHRKARMGRDPQTKAPINIPASNSVKFKPGKAMKDAVN